MKKILLFLVLIIITSSTFSQTLFTYGTQVVSKDEFLKAYNKNKTTISDKKNALKEYLDLYIKFKLKVRAAKDLRIDTLPSINTDVQNFRSQIEESYLDDQKQVNALVQEAFNRSQLDIHIAHLFVPSGKSSDPADTLKIYKAAQQAYNTLAIRHAAFSDVAEDIKKTGIAASWADVGFITVFTIPYEFENIVYNLKPGQISKVYRSKNGYHIFQNIEQRNAAGKMKAAQILIAVPPGANEEQKNEAYKIADSVYKILDAGADFSEVAKAISNDKTTYMAGGAMPEFGTGKYDAVFESKAFSLKKDGDITTPFQTSFGYHIIKRLSRTLVPHDKNDADYLYALKQQVQQDERISTAKEKFLKEILKTLGYKRNNLINDKDLWRLTDSFIVGKKLSLTSLNEKTTLHSFAKGKVIVVDWLQFAKNYKTNPGLYKGESFPELMQKYISVTAFEKYRLNLENYNIDFKYQLQEFKDGNMLFEIMERNVWNKASNDSAGLLRFYDQNKKKYYWNESADAVLISCSNAKTANNAAEFIRAGKSWNAAIKDDSLHIQADSGRYEFAQIPVKENTAITAGLVTEPIVNDADGTASFVQIVRTYPANQPRNFEEARGLVINDYQNLIEEKWIEQLKKKYPVKVNEKVFQSLLN